MRDEITAHESAADACVGKVMCPRIPDFLVYAKYLANFDHSLEVLGQITKKVYIFYFIFFMFFWLCFSPLSEIFVNFFFQEKAAALLKEAVIKSREKLDLGSYLIMPVQRLPRFVFFVLFCFFCFFLLSLILTHPLK